MNHHHQPFGLRTRLTALVIVPALLLGAIGATAALRKHHDAVALRSVRAEVDVLGRLTTLRTDLFSARVPVEVGVRAVSLGIDRDQALTLLDLQTFEGSDLGDAAAELARLPRAVRPFSSTRISELQAAVDRGADLAVVDEFDQLDQLAQRSWERQLGVLRERVVRSGDLALSRRLDDLEAATNSGSAAITMVTRLADYWFAVLGRTARAGPARASLVVADRDFDRWIGRLADSRDAGVAATAGKIRAAEPGTAFHTAIGDAVADQPPAPFRDGVDLDLVGKTFTSGFTLFGPLLDVISARSDQLRDSARQLSIDANRSALVTGIAVAVALSLLVLVSLLVASSIERPLRRLIEGTRRVGGGDLDVEPLPVDGPAEIGAATAAFNDVAANLRLLEGKVDALATGSFEDDRLKRPLPGALGDAMDQAIELLSGSMLEREVLREDLAYQASHDPLTSLSNRGSALEALESAMARAERSGSMLALAFLDLDGFKEINDTYGHACGDHVLRVVGQRLHHEARAGDICARLGGDEFLVVAENVADAEGALTLGQRLSEAVAAPIDYAHTVLEITTSVGIAIQVPGDDPVGLIARADVAVYESKRLGSEVRLHVEPVEAVEAERLSS